MIEIITLIASVSTLATVAWLAQSSKPKTSNGGTKLVIDTSTLMDGRVVELARAGFLSGTVYLPTGVMGELQQIADGSSSLKRERARHGLDILRELQNTDGISVQLVNSDDQKPVDDTLRELALSNSAALLTNDLNLAKVAKLEEIKVLNMNELAQALRPLRIPGERAEVKIIQKGAERDQGVGYLDDGTMIVVDHAAKRIGDVVQVSVTRTLQTSAGKMCFADIVNDQENRKSSN